MPTPVFLTVDTELVWRHHAAGLPLDEIFTRSLEPAGVGIGYQLDQLRRHGLKGVFFVDPMPALTFGLDVIRRIIEPILAAGQEVQLHLHPNWARATAGDGGATHADFELTQYPRDQQRDLIAGAAELLVAAGAPAPLAFRAGSFAANDDTLSALAELGFVYDSSHNGGEAPWPSEISLPPGQIAPIRHGGLIQLPVTVIEDLPGAWRPFQICAISTAEMRDALDHAAAHDHGAVTIVSHGFELSTRDGTRVNAVHRRRFDVLCEMLAERRAALPTVHFADAPALALDRADRPLGPSTLRTRWRQAEQFWSNQVVERAA